MGAVGWVERGVCWVGGEGGLCPTVREREGKREKRKEEGRERRENRGEKRVGLTCHVDVMIILNYHFNTV